MNGVIAAGAVGNSIRVRSSRNDWQRALLINPTALAMHSSHRLTDGKAPAKSCAA